MDNKKISIRTMAPLSCVKVREVCDGDERSRVLEGYVMKFGVRSRLLHDWYDGYYEILEHGCITREMLDKQDIKLTMFHDRHQILGRSVNGHGSLSYEVDDVGVKFTCEMPRTFEGEKALELVGRGDITGCSFCYSTNENDSVNCVRYERIYEDGHDVILRRVKRINKVYDFTLAIDPSFNQTEVCRRELQRHYEMCASNHDAADDTDKRKARELAVGELESLARREI